ncbi:MAG: aminotransferase [Proteobacteria bacterium]|nr:aminotransferase [Pseudomonadota bacterium]
MKAFNSVLRGYGTTVFEVFSLLAREHDAINLGQGFPDEDGPADLIEAAAAALGTHPNQYPPMMGLSELRQAVAGHDRRFYGIDADWQRQVLVTCGATEALASALFALIEPGDEVVLFEPLYDSYIPIVRRAGGIPRLVRLAPPDWRLDAGALAAAFSARTKLVLLNTPMNPAAKVFTRAELEAIAALLAAHDAYAVCDEVYEHLVFGPHAHVPLMTLPGMAKRCVRIASAGKSFSMTGWKVGYVTAAPELLAPIAKAHQFLTFTIAPNLQRAVALGLTKERAYFDGLAKTQAGKRDRLARGLRAIGFEVLETQGTYFLTAGFKGLGFNGDDVSFCRHLTETAKVTALPVSAFYEGGGVDGYVRFCFCKRDAVLDEAVARLEHHFGGAGGG